jgi:hypothetical protein
MKNDGNIVFKEEQKWENMWIPQAFLVLFVLAAIGQILKLHSMQKNHPILVSSESYMITGLMLVIPILLLGTTTLFKQITEVKNGSLRVYLYPLLDRFEEIKFDEIRSCEVRDLSPKDKAGKIEIKWKPRWRRGGRYAPSYEKGVYVVKGKKIVELELENGEMIKIGSQRPDELAAAINNGMNYNFNVPSPMNIKEKLYISRHLFLIFRIAFTAFVIGLMLFISFKNDLGLFDFIYNI